MTQVYKHTGGRFAVLALALSAILVGACGDSDDLISNNSTEVAFDGGTTAPAADSLVADSLVLDSLAVDSMSQLTSSALLAEASVFSRRSLAYGASGLWSGYTTLHSVAAPFTASTNYTDHKGIIRQISHARARGHQLVLNMTGGAHARYKTNGKFDLRKWKAVMNGYNTRDIKAAVAQGVSDGTIIMNTVMDEPNVKSWGGVMTKPLLDQMARYVKAMFPTLPVGVALRYDWRQNEKFKVMDAYLTQYGWNKGAVSSFRSKVLSNAQSQGMKVMFALNVLDGGPHTYNKSWSCANGRGTYFPTCRMSPTQLRESGRVLGPAGCGLMLWKYNSAFMSTKANVQAMKDVAATLSKLPGKSCRRG